MRFRIATAAIAAFVFVVTSGVAQPPRTDGPQSVSVNVDVANLRVEPSTSARVVGTVKRDDDLVVYAYAPTKSGGWYLVKMGRLRGWIKEDLTLPDIPESSAGRSGTTRSELRSKAESEGWKYITDVDAADRMQFFYHPETVERAGDTVKVWYLHIKDSGERTSTLAVIHCKRRLIMPLESNAYDKDGTLTSHDDLRGPVVEPSAIGPGVIFTLSRIVCAPPAPIAFYRAP